MYPILIIIDVLLAVILIALVLLQHGKGADAGAAFGSGSSATVFGAAGGASMMQKLTTWVAGAFFVVTMGLSMLAKDLVDASAVQENTPSSVVQQDEQSAPLTQQIPQEQTQDPVQNLLIESDTVESDTVSPETLDETPPATN